MLQHLLFQSTLWKGHLEQMFLSILIWCGNIKCPCIENPASKRILNSFSRPPLVQNSNLSVTLFFLSKFWKSVVSDERQQKKNCSWFSKGRKSFRSTLQHRKQHCREENIQRRFKILFLLLNNQLFALLCNHRNVWQLSCCPWAAAQNWWGKTERRPWAGSFFYNAWALNNNLTCISIFHALNFWPKPQKFRINIKQF